MTLSSHKNQAETPNNKIETRSDILPVHIANYFLWRAKKEGVKDITPLKLVKLVYFTYAWYYAVYNQKLFAEKIEAWQYGPVVPSIYHEFKSFGNNTIDRYAINFDPRVGEITKPIITKEDDEIIYTVNAVWKSYGNMDGWTLSKITHEGKNSPWKSAYIQGENNEIDLNLMLQRANQAIVKYRDVIAQ
ncbi:hypothetical protein LBMAG18_08240 [Alphaproteobacteria bacterium]|nr:hypothetical protein LBMAG18_08240 [Alphaproteobacteria bacterium]